MVMNDKAIKWLEKQLKDKKRALYRANEKPNTDAVELRNLKDAIAVIEWLMGVVEDVFQ